MSIILLSRYIYKIIYSQVCLLIVPFFRLFPGLAGLRGAIPYALSLHLGLEPIEKRQLIGTTTIIIVLFTILLMGGGTMPLIRIMDIEESKSRRKNKKDINLSKTKKMVKAERHMFHYNSLFVACFDTSSAIPSSTTSPLCSLQRGKHQRVDCGL